jgi:subtilase family protein
MCDRSDSQLRLIIGLAVAIMACGTAVGTFGTEPSDLAIIEIKSKASAKEVSSRLDFSVIDSIPELNKYLVRASTDSMQKMVKDPDVLSLEQDLQTELSETAMPNESVVALLDPSTVALLDEGQNLWDGEHPVRASMLQQPALQMIGFQQQALVGSVPVTVAVIDTGVDPLHEMLRGSTLPGLNFIDEHRNTDELLDLEPAVAAMLLRAGGRVDQAALAVLNPSTVALLDPSLIQQMTRTPSPYFGHGTLVSGLIHVIAPKALIMPLKAFDATGKGSSFRIAKAIVYAATAGADVINMSFSLELPSDLVDEALEFAAKRDLVLVASLGNKNLRLEKKLLNYPAAYQKVIGVAATDLNDRRTSFSNYGTSADVSAPGEGLMSAYPGGLYAVWSGTSGAAALVSGEAAMLLGRKAWKADEVTHRITDRVDHLEAKYGIGKGRINLLSALR